MNYTERYEAEGMGKSGAEYERQAIETLDNISQITRIRIWHLGRKRLVVCDPFERNPKAAIRLVRRNTPEEVFIQRC